MPENTRPTLHQIFGDVIDQATTKALKDAGAEIASLRAQLREKDLTDNELHMATTDLEASRLLVSDLRRQRQALEDQLTEARGVRGHEGIIHDEVLAANAGIAAELETARTKLAEAVELNGFLTDENEAVIDQLIQAQEMIDAQAAAYGQLERKHKKASKFIANIKAEHEDCLGERDRLRNALTHAEQIIRRAEGQDYYKMTDEHTGYSIELERRSDGIHIFQSTGRGF